MGDLEDHRRRLVQLETATLQAALQHGTLAQAQHSFGHHEAQRAYKALLRTADGFSPTTRMLVRTARPQSSQPRACDKATPWAPSSSHSPSRRP
jgi:hypothetical protein